MTENHAEAHKLHRAGLPITLCPPGSKKPLGKGWDAQQPGKAWQKKRWTLKEIDLAFKMRGELNSGVLYGPSSGLIDIEYDSGDGEAALVELFDGDPPIAPKFRSTRSPHRIVQFDPDLNVTDKATIHFGPLEIKTGANCKAAHSLWPTSTTNNVRREWLDGLDYFECDPPPLSKIAIERLLQRNLGAGRARQAEHRERRQHKTCLESSVSSVSSVFQSVETAIAATLPTAARQRHDFIFHFARHLTAIPHLAKTDPQSLRQYVQQWHQRALPFIRTKPFEETWLDFLEGWDKVKFAVGEGPIDTIFAQAVSRNVPPCAERYEQPEVRSLVALCRELQQAADDQPFFLDCRTAGRLLGVRHTAACRWLRLLVLDGVLRRITIGTRRRASEYRYLGD